MSDERHRGGPKDPSGQALLLAGLGNPGPQYAQNRHNAGFMFVDAVHDRHGFSPWRAKFDAHIAEGVLGGRRTYLLKPQTFMNLSGDSVGPALRFFKLPLSALAVAHDEIDLRAGQLKVKTGGGDAGQNGLRSITATLGPDYRRVRIGIGHPGEKHKVSGHVLQNFSKEDLGWLQPMLQAMAEAAPLLARDDDAGFMSKVALLLQPPKAEKPKSGSREPS